MRRKVGLQRESKMNNLQDMRLGEGMFLRIVGDEHSREIRDVSPDTAEQLVKHDKITFCTDCKVFHLEHGVTWDSLNTEIRALLN